MTLRSGLPHFSCATTACTARCHKKIECSGVSRYSTTQEWKCTKHGRRTTTPVVSTVPSTLPTNCAVCNRAFRARQRSLSCEDDSCSAQCHLKKSCSNPSRYSPEIWLCSSHSAPTSPAKRTIAVRDASSLTQAGPSQPVEKRTCKACMKTIASNIPGIQCPKCRGLFHKACVVKQGHTRDEVDLFAAGTDWDCAACDTPTPAPTPDFSELEDRARNGGKSSKEALRILQWNADGIKLKMQELAARVKELDIDVAIIQESKLRAKDKTPKIDGYSCIRVDRLGGKVGGGLLTFIKEDVAFESRKCWNRQTGNVESCSIRYRLSKKKWINVTNIYIPPTEKSTLRNYSSSTTSRPASTAFTEEMSTPTPASGTCTNPRTAEGTASRSGWQTTTSCAPTTVPPPVLTEGQQERARPTPSSFTLVGGPELNGLWESV